MTFHAARLAHLKTLDLPSDAEMVPRVRAFLIESGLLQREFAEACGLNPNSLFVWLSGAYAGKGSQKADQITLGIRAKLKSFLDKHEEAKDDFLDRPHYETQDFATIRRAAMDAMLEGVGYVVDGPPGTQKTHSFRRVAHEINEAGKQGNTGRAIYMRARCGQAPQSFLIECCVRAGIPCRGRIDQLIRKLRFHLAWGRTVLIVDEAQALSRNGLEIVRQLLDEQPYFGVILGGSHDISVTLKSWQMEQWRSRVRKTIMLSGPSRDEAEDILLQQLGPMHRDDLRDTIDEAMTWTRREGERVDYISARALFDAIRSAKQAMAEPQPVAAAGGAR